MKPATQIMQDGGRSVALEFLAACERHLETVLLVGGIFTTSFILWIVGVQIPVAEWGIAAHTPYVGQVLLGTVITKVVAEVVSHAAASKGGINGDD